LLNEINNNGGLWGVFLWYTVFIGYFEERTMTLPSGFKSYLPKLLLIARAVCNYIRRYQDKIAENLGEDGVALLAAVLVACDALEVAIVAVLPPDV
jgi:hypothetical protein